MWQFFPCNLICQISLISLFLLLFSRSVVSDSAIPWTATLQASLSITNSQSLLKLMSIESVIPFNHLILCLPLLLLLSIFPSIRVFSNESVLCIRWPEYWSFSSVLPMNIQGWFPLGWTGLISCSLTDSQEFFSNTAVQKHQFFSAQPSLWSSCHIHTLRLEKQQLWLYAHLLAK